MKRTLNFILLMLITSLVYGQADYNRTNPTGSNPANTGTYNKQSIVDANLKARLTLFVPRGPVNTLNNAKDSVGALFYNTTSNKLNVYKGGGVWESLSGGGNIPKTSFTTTTETTVIDWSSTIPGETITYAEKHGTSGIEIQSEDIFGNIVVPPVEITRSGGNIVTVTIYALEAGSIITII